MDCLHITGIRAYGYTGFLPEERSLGQWFEADLTLWLDLSRAGNSDRLEDTYDYSSVVTAIQTLIQTAQFKLIESLAEAIAQSVLSNGAIEQVRVRLTKLTPPIPNFDGSVSIEITRSRT
jgi:7,8-dihydroneopterin aldolase/epimerase/oxygenase